MRELRHKVNYELPSAKPDRNTEARLFFWGKWADWGARDSCRPAFVIQSMDDRADR